MIRTIGLIALLGFLGCKNHYPKMAVELAPESGSLIIQHVDIFNGRDSALLVGMDVLIENGIIQKIARDIPFQSGYEIIDGRGKTLTPGFVDTHVHLTGSGSVPWESVSADEAYNLSAYLYAGVTCVYDLGGLGNSLEKLQKKQLDGALVGPSIYHTHVPITLPNAHPIPLTEELLPWPLKSLVNAISPTISKSDEAAKLIDNYVKNDIDYVKIICDQIPSGSPEMTYPILKALIDASHEKGYKVFVHIGSPKNALDALKAGADVLAHGVWRGALTEAQADTIASYNKPIIYTAAAFKNVDAINHGKYSPNTLDSVLVPNAVLDPVTMENGTDVSQQPVMSHFFNDVTDQRAVWRNNFKLLYDRKVTLLVGTDSSLPGTYAGSTYIQECSVLKDYGMSNFDILRGATYLASKAFLDRPNFGLIEAGYQADMLLFDKNPLIDLEVIGNPDLILKAGRTVSKL